MNKSNQNKYEIFTCPMLGYAHAYVMELAGNGSCEYLYTAPLFKDGTVDHTQWGTLADDDAVCKIIDSPVKVVIDEMPIDEFNKLLFGEKYE